MNLDQDFFQVSKLSEDQKKRSLLEMEHFFSPNLSTNLRSDAHQSQIIGGDADKDHTQIVGGYTVKLLGGYIPPGFGTPGGVYHIKIVGGRSRGFGPLAQTGEIKEKVLMHKIHCNNWSKIYFLSRLNSKILREGGIGK